jgi:outer membrane protein assembly factor BamB
VALCLDTKNGEIIWSTILNASPEVTGGARSHPGPRSTPTVALGKVYTLGVSGNLNCLDSKTGKVIWKNDSFPEVPQFFTSASSLVTEGLCIIHLGGKENGCIVAFKANTGEIAWKLEKEPSTYSSPVLMKSGKEEIVVIQTESHLLGITLKGELLWKYATPGEQRFYNSTTPIIEGQTIFIVGQGKGTTKLVASKTGKSWNISETWRNPDFGGSFNTPVLKNGFLYGNEARLGKLYCINSSTGATAWADTVGYNRFAATFYLGEIMLSQPANGKLIFYEANPQKYVTKAIYKASDTEIYAHPLVTGNKIYIKDKENLTCFSIE